MDEKESISLSSLVLARLLSRGGRGETPSAIRSGLRPLVGGAWSGSELLRQVREHLEELERQGLVERVSSRGSACALTPVGKERACAFLGLDRIPARIGWSAVRDTYLFAKAMGIEPSYLKKRGLDGARAVVLARTLELPWRPSSTLTSVLDSYLARAHGLGSQPRYALRPAIVARSVATGEKATDEGPAQPVFDLEAFAREVLAAAAACRTGCFGDDKVFISHVWPLYAERPGRRVREVEAFKRRLVEAHRADLLTLVRADLVEAMDPGDVAESETRYLNAAFHFIRRRGDS
jgi:hypothetical protein